MRYIAVPFSSLTEKEAEEFDDVMLAITNDSQFYNSLNVEQCRDQDALILDEDVAIALRRAANLKPLTIRLVRGRLTRYTEALNIHYDLLRVIFDQAPPKRKEPIMATAIALKDEEVNAPLSTIQVCAGMRLDGMSESEMVHQLKNFQEKIDKLKALKVSSKKIKASIKSLEEQLEALVEAYDAI